MCSKLTKEITFNYLIVNLYIVSYICNMKNGGVILERMEKNMELYLFRVGYSKEYLPIIAHIFGLGYYIPIKEETDDEYSKKIIYFYKYGNDTDFFIDKIKDLYQLRFAGDEIKFDILTIYPTHKKGILNPNIDKLIEEVSKRIDIPYNRMLIRNRDIKPNHELKTVEERIKNVRDSIDLKEDILGKNIMIFDNVSISGISLIDVTNFLYENGAEHVVCICLGLSNRNKKTDWNDLNYTLKYSKIKKICKTPYVDKEEREKWKMTQLQK